MKKQRTNKDMKTQKTKKATKLGKGKIRKDNSAKNKMQLPPQSVQHLPASQKQLYLVREELIEKISSVEHSLKSDFSGLRSEFHLLKSDVHKTNSNVERLLVLVEEQNNRNKITLDYLASLFERQERVEVKLDAFLNVKTNKDV